MIQSICRLDLFNNNYIIKREVTSMYVIMVMKEHKLINYHHLMMNLIDLQNQSPILRRIQEIKFFVNTI